MGRNLIARNGVVTMANTNSSVRKPTKKQMFTALLAMPGLSQEQKDFIQHEIDLLEKKNSGEKKPTATQVANEGIKQEILDGMVENRLYTITEMMKEIPAYGELTNQKISALLKQMVEAENPAIKKIVDKRKTYFQLV